MISWSSAQIKDPVKWKTTVQTIDQETFDLILTGTIEPHWHVYSQFTPEGGSLPAELTWTPTTESIKYIGKTKESPYIKKHNVDFDVDEYFFENKVVFTQRIKRLQPSITEIKVKIDYQACKESCTNLKKTFVFKLPVASTEMAAQAVTNVDTVAATTLEAEKQVAQPKEQTVVSKSTELSSEKEASSSKGLWALFWWSFLGGFTALLTPCVFPMIPMTVSYFTKRNEKRAQGIQQALWYGLSIIILYVLLGWAVTAIFGADALNALSTNPWFNLIFFVILIVFACSFLGAFELVLPYSWSNKIDQKAEKGGVIGILFMALALAIVSFSCTGPIVGTLLVEAASMGGISPLVGMLGFSTALALPFMLFALFPGWLASLPQSGGWLNTVKVSLGFLELALAFKFLSTADLVLQLHLVEREVFLALWIAIFGAWTLYLFGKIKTAHDSQVMHLSVGRLLLAMLVLSFTIYLIPGLFGAPLKLISGFPPPDHYSESSGFLGKATSSAAELPEGAEKGPLGLTVFTDYTQGMSYAKKVHKPALIDFTGYGCQNCRRMESNVWSLPEIKQILANEVIVISLYVDNKKPLPADKQYVSKVTGNTIETVGDQWTEMIITRYKANSQPYYVLLDEQEKTLTSQSISVASGGEFQHWLDQGIQAFKRK
ncbi:MAG: thiol:disulfide interchange protein [Flavobacterium sp. BFFFF2]|nr:MAG: thiol:disulfide interchange protein [Flavobacterium sp. BFFFF2]